jgi:hypothetical protein
VASLRLCVDRFSSCYHRQICNPPQWRPGKMDHLSQWPLSRRPSLPYLFIIVAHVLRRLVSRLRCATPCLRMLSAPFFNTLRTLSSLSMQPLLSYVLSRMPKSTFNLLWAYPSITTKPNFGQWGFSTYAAYILASFFGVHVASFP